MKIIIHFFLLFTFIGCKEKDVNLDVDHFNIWVQNPSIAKEKLQAIGFTAVPDSLCDIHTGQGTTGRYFYFLNGYLELIYVYDSTAFISNAKKNHMLDFVERSQSPQNGYLPFSLALRMKRYNKNELPFKTVEYKQEWMGEDNCILVAKNSKLKKEEPSLFVIFPEINYPRYESLEDLSTIPDEYAFLRSFYKHANGAEKLSKIEIHSQNIDQASNSINCLNSMKHVEIKEGDEYLMELYFDHHRQQKTYDLRPELPLIVHL